VRLAQELMLPQEALRPRVTGAAGAEAAGFSIADLLPFLFAA